MASFGNPCREPSSPNGAAQRVPASGRDALGASHFFAGGGGAELGGVSGKTGSGENGENGVRVQFLDKKITGKKMFPDIPRDASDASRSPIERGDGGRLLNRGRWRVLGILAASPPAPTRRRSASLPSGRDALGASHFFAGGGGAELGERKMKKETPQRSDERRERLWESTLCAHPISAVFPSFPTPKIERASRMSRKGARLGNRSAGGGSGGLSRNRKIWKKHRFLPQGP